MASPHTKKDVPCPLCGGEEATTHVALLPTKNPATGGEMLPHMYAVGPNCYRRQWALVYPGEECPLTIESEAPTKPAPSYAAVS